MAATKASICTEKQRLTDELVQAAREIAELHNREIASLLEGGTGLDRFDIALKRARERRDEAKQALGLHTLEHGC